MRRKPVLIVAAVSLMALAACGDNKVETAKAEKGASVSIAIDGNEAKTTEATAESDTESGKIELSLPGGIEAKGKLPEGLGNDGDFDIDGVGLYPGARVGSVKVNASDAAAMKRAVVRIGFTAPGDAAAVADWYQQQFDAKAIKVSRRGETLSGKTEDGNDFTIALTGAGAGSAKGLVTIVNAAKG